MLQCSAGVPNKVAVLKVESEIWGYFSSSVDFANARGVCVRVRVCV